MSEAIFTPTGEAEGVTVDPFAFFPNQASRIRGLGGSVAPNDPANVFHTAYMFCKPGKVVFSFHIEGLEATSGDLTVRVHALSPVRGSSAQTIKMLSYKLPDLAETDGRLEVSFNAKPAMMYAVIGLIYGLSDATARSLSAILDKPDDGSSLSAEGGRAKYTDFSAPLKTNMTRLVADERATLATPVSQTCTSSQFDEKAYARWLASLGVENARDRKQWEAVYILQALSSYGMLQPGARGIAFGIEDGDAEALPAILAARGCEIVATFQPVDDEGEDSGTDAGQPVPDCSSLRRPALCPDDRFNAAVTCRPANMNSLPDDLIDFDFCWSASALEQLGSVAAGRAFVLGSLACLKIGGVAVHTTEFIITEGSVLDNDPSGLFRRGDFERLALDLISEGHFVAQFKFDRDKKSAALKNGMRPAMHNERIALSRAENVETTSYGIIVQRGA